MRTRIISIIGAVFVIMILWGCLGGSNEPARKQLETINRILGKYGHGASIVTFDHNIDGTISLRCSVFCNESTTFCDKTTVELAGMKGLYWLDASATKIGDDGLVNLATLPDLQYLQVAGCEITTKGLMELSSNPTLQFLDLRNCRLLKRDDIDVLGRSQSLKVVFVNGTAFLSSQQDRVGFVLDFGKPPERQDVPWALEQYPESK